MFEDELHSTELEKLAGNISCDIVSQQDNFRKVHLRDQHGISRTMGLVSFINGIVDGPLLEVHKLILEGGLLGKTLSDSGLPFHKQYQGSCEVALPHWLQKEFSTDSKKGLALFSKILVGSTGQPQNMEVYAHILEIIPPGLMNYFSDKAAAVQHPDKEMLALAKFGQLDLHLSARSAKMRCIVVGAGPGGITAVKELLEQGVESVLCLEQATQIGGIFTRSYDNLILTSSVTFSMFSDFWVGDGKDHHFWTKEEAVAYWTAYAKHFGVLEHTRLGVRVEAIREQEDGCFKVTIDSGETLVCDHLILAIGNNNIPRFPEWSEQLTAVSYSHSVDYKNAGPYKGKRVLMVGGGESGSDVAYEISKVASNSWVSLRESTGWIVPRRRGGHAADVSTHRGIWDLPRDYGKILSPFVLKLERARKDPVFDALADLNERIRSERGIWGIFGTKTLALPKAIAHHGCKVVGDIVAVEQGGKSLRTADGELIEGLDHVVFSTGYVNRADFMPKQLQVNDPRKMYKHMFLPEYGSRIAWIGWARPGFGSQFPVMEMQARYAALLVSGKMQLPEKEEMHETIQADYLYYREQFEENADRIRSLVDYHRYMNSMARIMDCYPPIKRYFFLRPKLWLHLMYGPTQATQFRLRGPGKKVAIAHEILHKLPISTFNHIVKAGLRGRIRYGLKSLSPKSARSRSVVGREVPKPVR